MFIPLIRVLFISVPSTPYGDCKTGDAQLASSTNDTLQNTTTGTVQICINNAWGGVCNDDLFGIDDAQVACQQAGGYERQVVGDILSIPSTGPIFLSELDCEGDEQTLLDCQRYARLGSECASNEGVVITCRGMSTSQYYQLQANLPLSLNTQVLVWQIIFPLEILYA